MWGSGQQIPTVDELAEEFGVARATIRQAIGLSGGRRTCFAFSRQGNLCQRAPASSSLVRGRNRLERPSFQSRGRRNRNPEGLWRGPSSAPRTQAGHRFKELSVFAPPALARWPPLSSGGRLHRRPTQRAPRRIGIQGQDSDEVGRLDSTRKDRCGTTDTYGWKR